MLREPTQIKFRESYGHAVVIVAREALVVSWLYACWNLCGLYDLFNIRGSSGSINTTPSCCVLVKHVTYVRKSVAYTF